MDHGHFQRKVMITALMALNLLHCLHVLSQWLQKVTHMHHTSRGILAMIVTHNR